VTFDQWWQENKERVYVDHEHMAQVVWEAAQKEPRELLTTLRPRINAWPQCRDKELILIDQFLEIK